jgi:hypothetical protein
MRHGHAHPRQRLRERERVDIPLRGPRMVDGSVPIYAREEIDRFACSSIITDPLERVHMYLHLIKVKLFLIKFI